MILIVIVALLIFIMGLLIGSHVRGFLADQYINNMMDDLENKNAREIENTYGITLHDFKEVR